MRNIGRIVYELAVVPLQCSIMETVLHLEERSRIAWEVAKR